MMDDALALLESTPLESLVSGVQDVVLLEHSASVADALKTLAACNILSAPLVVNPGLEDVETLSPAEASPQLLGWIDIKDILRAFLTFLHERCEGPLPSNMLALMAELERQGPAFASRTLITVIGSDDRGLIFRADAGESVLSAIRDVFLSQAAGAKLVHRLAVFDAHGDITNVVSQSDVLRFLLRNSDRLGAVAQQTLSQLGLLSAERSASLVTLEPHTPTLLAFERLLAAGLTAAPVLSAEGEVMGNLSASDMRGIQPDHLGVLALPVAEFLAVQNHTSFLGYSQQGQRSGGAKGSNGAHPFFASRARQQRQRRLKAATRAALGTGTANTAAAANGSGGDSGDEDGGGCPGAGGSDGVPLITCGPDATLIEAVGAMVGNAVHRVYVVGPSGTLMGLVTPTDVLALLAGVALPLPVAVPAGSRATDAQGSGHSAKRAKTGDGSSSISNGATGSGGGDGGGA